MRLTTVPVSMHTTLVINAKGGVGKTTIATNLASYFAVNSFPTAILDYDPQGSSLDWLSRRPPEAVPIHGANGATRTDGRLGSIQRYVPRETERLILDAPAGPSRLLLQDMLNRTSCILIPVAPSVIDIQATASFIKELLLVGGIRIRNMPLGVVANRVRTSTSVYEPLERFVASLRLSFVARVLDSEVYTEAAEAGRGIFEMDPELSADQREEFTPLIRWLNGDVESEVSSLDKVVPFKHARG
jgi:chromosome partitioning protein